MSGAAPGSAVPALRVAAIGPFKFPGGARPHQTLDAHARVVGRMGRMIRIEGEVRADGVPVAIGSVTLADVTGRVHRQPAGD
jgi:hypothetical protein